MTEIKISIIVPIYNVEKYIEKCISSILNQSYSDYELILVDDGSTDNSGKICDCFSKHNSNIKVIHKLNGGQSSARNIGMSVAQGKYIGFVDADDLIDNDMYKILYYNLLKYNADISGCNFYRVVGDKKQKQYSIDGDKIYEFSRNEALKELPNNVILTYSLCNKLFKRELFNNLKFKEGMIYEDLDIIYRLISKSKNIIYTSKCLYYYNYNTNSTLNSTFKMQRLDEFKMKSEMHDFYLRECPEAADKVYLECFFSGIRLYCNILNCNNILQDNYKYLIEFNKIKLLNLVYNSKLLLRRKLIIIGYIISKKTLVKVCKRLL